MNELSNGIIEFIRIAIQLVVEISELVEDELFSLSVLKEKESNQILVAEIHELLCGKSCIRSMFLFAEVFFEHKFVHWGVESDCLVCFSSQVVLFFEDLY